MEAAASRINVHVDVVLARSQRQGRRLYRNQFALQVSKK